MNARRVAKELEVQIRGINRNAPSVPPNGSPEERKQVSKKIQIWRVNRLKSMTFILQDWID